MPQKLIFEKQKPDRSTWEEYTAQLPNNTIMVVAVNPEERNNLSIEMHRDLDAYIEGGQELASLQIYKRQPRENQIAYEEDSGTPALIDHIESVSNSTGLPCTTRMRAVRALEMLAKELKDEQDI